MATTDADLIEFLSSADMEIEGRLVDASNVTLRVILNGRSEPVRAVYKPIRGERPLWDFPEGTLAAREVAAYRLSAALGWDVVPSTVMRDGPLGPGSCQLWLDELDEPPIGFVPAEQVPDGWLPIVAAEDDNGKPYLLAHADDPRLARLALFDAIANNADRKGGHVLASGPKLLGVDHGVCFHTDDKLRTVLWGFAGRPVEPPLLAELHAVELGRLADLLSTVELTALEARRASLLRAATYPRPPERRHAIPWPPI